MSIAESIYPPVTQVPTHTKTSSVALHEISTQTIIIRLVMALHVIAVHEKSHT